MPIKKPIDWIGPIVGALTILGVIVGAAISWGEKVAMDNEQNRRIEKLEQVFILTHPVTADAFGVTDMKGKE